jgi:hypothetical protein
MSFGFILILLSHFYIPALSPQFFSPDNRLRKNRISGLQNRKKVKYQALLHKRTHQLLLQQSQVCRQLWRPQCQVMFLLLFVLCCFVPFLTYQKSYLTSDTPLTPYRSSGNKEEYFEDATVEKRVVKSMTSTAVDDVEELHVQI